MVGRTRFELVIFALSGRCTNHYATLLYGSRRETRTLDLDLVRVLRWPLRHPTLFLVGVAGFEPARLAATDFESGVSAVPPHPHIGAGYRIRTYNQGIMSPLLRH